MINAYELVILPQLQSFWAGLLSNIGTPNDLIPEIFAFLPPDGDEGANWKAIGDAFVKMSTGSSADDVSFLLQFPSTRASIPCVTVEVGAEGEEEVIGSFVEQDFDPATQKTAQFIGGPFTKTYAVGVYSFNPDTTLYLYSVVKYALLIIRDTLDSASNIAISGRPMQIDFQRYVPDPAYIRYIDIRVEGVLDTATKYFETVKSVVVQPDTYVSNTTPETSG